MSGFKINQKVNIAGFNHSGDGVIYAGKLAFQKLSEIKSLDLTGDNIFRFMHHDVKIILDECLPENKLSSTDPEIIRAFRLDDEG